MAQIIIKNLKKTFGEFVAVKSSSFTIEDGEFFMLLGPSGCGKTTTLRMIAGLELPTEGQVFIDGEEVGMKPASERDIAFVFQMFALYPHMNVYKNISYPLVSQGMKRNEVKKRVEETANILGIQDILKRPVSGLSGGDRQRVALGRAIVRNPKAFMMDEPLGALDSEFREKMAEELRALHDRMNATTVYVTHDQLEAMQMGDKIVVMNDGVVEQFGTPREIYDKPLTTFVAEFIGSPPMNLIEINQNIKPKTDSVTLGDKVFQTPTQLEEANEKIILGVRPEHIKFSSDSSYKGNVIATEYLGTTQIITIQTKNGELKARTDASTKIKTGENIGLEFNPETITLFNKNTKNAIRSKLNEEIHPNG